MHMPLCLPTLVQRVSQSESMMLQDQNLPRELLNEARIGKHQQEMQKNEKARSNRLSHQERNPDAENAHLPQVPKVRRQKSRRFRGFKKEVVFRESLESDCQSDTSSEKDLNHSNGASRLVRPTLGHRQTFSRFELVEDRFLALTNSQNQSPTPTTRGKIPHINRPVIKEIVEEEPHCAGEADIKIWPPILISPMDKTKPLLRFKKAVRIVVLLLRAVYTDRKRTQLRERQLNIWIDVSDSGLTSRRAYETYGLTFDLQDFKANRQIQITAEAKAVLSMNTGQRSTNQIHSVLVSLRQAVPEFSEFPITMQESLARVGWYEKFEAKRVIIRQGHMADNFYFILSGTAVVIILETDKVTGEQKARTAAILGRGKSFGELALMHKARRSATVTCREEVELLAVGRDDFVDIFMHVERGVEPEHVRFLRGLPIFRGWPVELLPYDNPKILLFTYVRRGVVLCHDSNSSEWIFVIKSGHCRIIKCLPLAAKKRNNTRPVRLLRRDNDDVDNNNVMVSSTPFVSSSDWLSLKTPTDSQKGHELPFVSSKSLQDQRKMALIHVQTLDAILEQKHPIHSLKSGWCDSHRADHGKDTCQSAPIFVQVLKLGAKDVYGLEASVFNSVSKAVSTSLVSDGAELIMINRKFFLENTSSDLKKYIRKEIHPLPSEDSLQIQLKTQMEWESYRHQTLQKTVGAMRLVESLKL